MIKSVLENPIITTERKMKKQSLKRFIHDLVRKEVSRKALNDSQNHTKKKSRDGKVHRTREAVRIDER